MKIILIRSRFIDSAVFKIAESLAENGHSVTLLIWDRQNNYRKDNDDKKYSIKRFRLKAPYDRWTALFYLPIWWIYEFYFLLLQKADVIHACDFDTLWPAILVKFIKKTTLFYIIYDFYADNILESNSSFRKTIAFLEKHGIKYTDTLFLVDESRYEQVKGSKIKKIVYIYNSPRDNFPQKDKKVNDKFTIFYAGLLDNSRGIKYIIKALNELNSTELLIAGNGNCKSVIKEISKSKKNINYIGWVDHDVVLDMSLKADVLFAFYDPAIPNNKYASPNKLFEAMMCGKPIIMNSETSASKIVQFEDCGVIVDYGDVKSTKKALIELIKKPELRKKLGENGRKAYENKYSWKIMEKRLLSAYNEL